MSIAAPTPGTSPGPMRSLGAPTEDLPGERLHAGHRALLATLREFARELAGTPGVPPEPAVVRAAVAFLRQSLLPFAHREDRHPAGCVEVAEDTAFEHAFLTAEIDALAGAAVELDGGRGNTGEVTERIRRHAHRIEAVLELHVQKAEDRAGRAPVGALRAGSGRGEATGGARSMDPAEVQRFLRRHEWGMLCTVGDGVPYAVPVSYGFDGRYLYVASGRGRKRRNLESTPAVCLTVAEVEDGDRWSSVVVTGEALPVTGLRERLHALDALRRQRALGAAPSAADLARIARASIFRIDPCGLTGRARG